jgi:phosphate transport system permease protein
MTLENRRRLDKTFYWVCQTITWTSVLVLGILLFHLAKEGWAFVDSQFLTSFPSRHPDKAGLKSAIWGTIWIIGLTIVIAVPLSVATALFLEEYGKKSRLMHFLEVNISNLAGMPSIVYGLLGLAIFVRFFGFDRSILSGALTLSLLIMPIIVIAAQGAIRAVPLELRQGAYALGARKWQVLIWQVLPAALPGIMTGVILAISRAIGETAPLIIVGAYSYVAFLPESIQDPFTVLPVQIFNWAGRPQAGFHGIAAAGIIILLLLLFTMNLIAVLIRQKFQRYQ